VEFEFVVDVESEFDPVEELEFASLLAPGKYEAGESTSKPGTVWVFSGAFSTSAPGTFEDSPLEEVVDELDVPVVVLGKRTSKPGTLGTPETLMGPILASPGPAAAYHSESLR
jgi:hypothetical protein